MPNVVNIETINRCNSTCAFCTANIHAEKRPFMQIDMDLYKSIIDQLADEFKGEAIVGKVNIDENEEAAVRYNVASIPTMIIFKDGQEVDRIVGARPRPQLAEMIRKHL